MGRVLTIKRKVDNTWRSDTYEFAQQALARICSFRYSMPATALPLLVLLLWPVHAAALAIPTAPSTSKHALRLRSMLDAVSVTGSTTHEHKRFFLASIIPFHARRMHTHRD